MPSIQSPRIERVEGPSGRKTRLLLSLDVPERIVEGGQRQYPPSMGSDAPETPSTANAAEAVHVGWLVLAIVLLLVAYLPFGFLAPLFGLQYAWELVSEKKSLVHTLWGAWLVIATLVGNLQIFACLASPHRPSIWLQNQYWKSVATFGQLSWVFFGIYFLPWFPWVIGSALLFTITPCKFRWPAHTETWTQDWRRHRLLQPQSPGGPDVPSTSSDTRDRGRGLYSPVEPPPEE